MERKRLTDMLNYVLVYTLQSKGKFIHKLEIWSTFVSLMENTLTELHDEEERKDWRERQREKFIPSESTILKMLHVQILYSHVNFYNVPH